jgi:uncharacterized protein YjiS (DUF1127 family)
MRTSLFFAQPEAPLAWSALSMPVVRIANAMRDWRRIRRAEPELLAMDDRYLADMGISRSQISDAVRGNYRNAQ